ncbi:MAG: hypothetical protein KF752_16880 [Pirellulaceae bacterium]|nr:hypothetical protein [Pirellulaceae bacterium]
MKNLELAVALLAVVLLGWVVTPAQGQDSAGRGQLAESRAQDIQLQLRILRGLLSEMGLGHPKVQEQIRRVKYLEEDLRFELTIRQRIAARFAVQEESLGDQFKQRSQNYSERQTTYDQQFGPVLTNLETLQVLEKDCLQELQRIDWDLASERAILESSKQETVPSPPPAATSTKPVKPASSPSTSGGSSASQSDTVAKPQSPSTAAALRIKSLEARREVVMAHIESLIKQRGPARELQKIHADLTKTEQQIGDVQALRIQYEAKQLEYQTLLDLVRETIGTVQVKDKKLD